MGDVGGGEGILPRDGACRPNGKVESFALIASQSKML
jgi:hypothetical protein